MVGMHETVSLLHSYTLSFLFLRFRLKFTFFFGGVSIYCIGSVDWSW